MGCSSSKSTATLDDSQAPAKGSKMETPNTTPDYPASEAFTIPLDTAEATPLNETLRQPPKRLMELMQQAAVTEPATLEELEDKQQRAEQRRQELMQQKLETIQKNTQMLMRQPERLEKTEEESEQPPPE